jgi:pimeloyl-ACP methyl ester carboxylesterase
MSANRVDTHFGCALLGVFACLVLLLNASLRSDEVDEQEPSSKLDALPNVAAKTMGGKQFWTDEMVRGEWRIQKNCVTGHYRLLDDQGVRKTWGKWEHCKQEWDELDKAGELPALKKKVVLVLHGLVRSRDSMTGIAEFLADEGEYSVLNLTYASTRLPIAEHAAALQRVITRLEGVEEISFVAHSMGNLVIRHFIGDQLIAARGLGIDPRIQRIVMLAPPNGGADLAKRFQNNVVFRVIFGASGQQLGKQWEDLENRLAVPPCDFGIIAGGAGDEEGRNPLLEGDDDMVVTVQETRLPGARDFVVVPALHTLIMDNPKVREYTKRFLDEGHFVSEAERQPIPVDEAAGGDTR